jgi:Flp pilus assembly protein TadD
MSDAESGAQQKQPDDPLPYLQSAISLLALGDAKAALVAASEACHRAPQMPEAHYVYGEAFAALGLPARAEQAFARAIQLKPHFADAWVNYGIAHYRQGRIEDAKTAMRRAIAVDPQHAAAASNLGAFMRISGETEGGEKLLQALIARNPKDIGARLNLAADLLQEERAQEALDLLQQVAPPDDARIARAFHLQQSLALLQLKRTAEARLALDALVVLGPVPPALAPLLHWRLVLLALAEGDIARARAEASAMEAALPLMGPDAVPEHAIMAHYDLAKFWSMQNAPARAMAQWSAGHKLLARFQPFSRQAHRAFVDASIAAFGKARLHDGPRAGNKDDAPVFVVGMPRSGTTLVEQILSAHRDAFGAGERGALGQTFFTLGGGASDADAVRKIAELDGDTLGRVANDYLAQLHALAPRKARIVDKLPGNFLYLGLAALLFPKAKIIHCRRDPRDIGLSIFTFRFHGVHAYAHDLADLGWYIGEHDRLMAHWRAVLPNPILTISLADWVTDFDATLSRLLQHLGLPPDENCSRFHEQDSRVRTVSRAQVRQPINARGLGRWRSYALALAPLIAELDQAGSLAGWS